MSEPVQCRPADPPAVARGDAGGALIPVGQPYHLLARNSVHTWWRPLAALALLVVLEVIAVITAAVVLMGAVLFPVSAPWRFAEYAIRPKAVDDALNAPMAQLLLGFALIIALGPPLVLVARWIQKRPGGSLTGVVGRMRWRWFRECVLLALPIFAVAFAVIAASDLIAGTPQGPGFPGWPDYLRIVLVAVLVVPLQSAVEEYVFRGFLLQTLTAWFRTPWPGMALCSVLFLTGHGYTDPLVWCELFLMAMSASWLAIRTGGLEAPIGLHLANNTLSLVVSGLSGVPNLDQGGDYPLMQVLPLAVATIGYTWLVDRRAVRREVSNVIGGRVRIHPLSLKAHP